VTELSGSAAGDEIDRQLPAGDEIFLDHVAHFVRDAGAASRAFARCGFAPTPVSIQADPDPAGGARPTGTGNITVMLRRGYVEVLFKTSDTALSRELDAAIDRHVGLHLVAFAVADAARAHHRLGSSGFRVRDLARMQRPVETAAGTDSAAFTIARVQPEMMPEGRIQILTHHSEQVVWQPRWLAQPNSAVGLLDVVIAVADVEEAAQRFARFAGRPVTRTASGGALLHLDRGGVNLISHQTVTERLPEVAITRLPFIAGYALRVQSIAAAEAAVEHAGLEWRALDDGIVAAFPVELGEGAWFFVEGRAALPWRR
jgi:hypothetical protein